MNMADSTKIYNGIREIFKKFDEGIWENYLEVENDDDEQGSTRYNIGTGNYKDAELYIYIEENVAPLRFNLNIEYTSKDGDYGSTAIFELDDKNGIKQVNKIVDTTLKIGSPSMIHLHEIRENLKYEPMKITKDIPIYLQSMLKVLLRTANIKKFDIVD